MPSVFRQNTGVANIKITHRGKTFKFKRRLSTFTGEDFSDLDFTPYKTRGTRSLGSLGYVFDSCSFTRARLEEMKLTNHIGGRTIFRSCNFNKANLRKLHVGANIEKCLFNETVMPEGSFLDVEACRFENANLKERHFGYINNSEFDGCDLKGAGFDGCSGATFKNSDLSRAFTSSFKSTFLKKSSFLNCNLARFILGPTVENCVFRGSVFGTSANGDHSPTPMGYQQPLLKSASDSDFSGVVMDGVLLTAFTFLPSVDWKRSTASQVLKSLYERERASIKNCSFREASLVNSAVIGAEFIDCDFRNTDLSGADLSFTRFVNCNFQGSRYRDALLFETIFEDCIEASDLAPTDPRWKRSAPQWYEDLEIQEFNAKTASERKPVVYQSPSKPVVLEPSKLELEARKKRSRRRKSSISKALRYEVLKRDGFRCLACGRSPNSHPGLVLHIDHVIPESKGGATDLSNLQTLCEDDNIGKGNRDDTDLRK